MKRIGHAIETGIGITTGAVIMHKIIKAAPAIIRKIKTRVIHKIVRGSKRIIRKVIKRVGNWWNNDGPGDPESPFNPENPESPFDPGNYPGDLPFPPE